MYTMTGGKEQISSTRDTLQPVYLSSDFGLTWAPSPYWVANPPPAGGLSFYRVTSSADGTKLAAAEREGGLYTSSNSGATWVMRSPVGGFNASDPSPTLAEIQKLVSNGEIHYFIGGSTIGASNGGSSVSGTIASWVANNFTATTIDGVTLYDLSGGANS